jgi:CBS domain-containing protein
MQAADIMSKVVISVAPDTAVADVAALMLNRAISSVTVVGPTGRLLGIITEGDLLRRIETGTERRPSRWLEMVSSNAALAADYVRSRARKACDVMTRPVVTARETTSLRDIVDLMEAKHVKRLPIVQDDVVVGIVSRANLIRALATGAGPRESLQSDREIRAKLLDELAHQRWADAAGLHVIVSHGVIHLWGTVQSPEERAAVRVAAENVGGRGIEDHLVQLPALPPL